MTAPANHQLSVTDHHITVTVHAGFASDVTTPDD
jgi:hypothetical protein